MRSAHAQTLAVPIATVVHVISCRDASDLNMLASRATWKAGGLRAKLPRKRGIPAKRSRIVDGRCKVAVEANAATVQKSVGILIVIIAAEAKHVALLHWQDWRCDLGIRLKDLAGIDVAK